MKIELDSELSTSNKIISYSNSSFRLKDSLLEKNIVISKNRLVENWNVESYHNLATHHLDQIISWQPELIIIGSGSVPSFPNAELIEHTASRNIGLEIMDTGAACRSYNLLIDEGRDVVACLFLSDN